MLFNTEILDNVASKNHPAPDLICTTVARSKFWYETGSNISVDYQHSSLKTLNTSFVSPGCVYDSVFC